MAYEYEDEIKEELEFIRFEFIGNQNEMLRELQEVIEGKNSDLLFTEDEIIQLEKDLENKHNLLSEISQHIGNKPSSSTYKYFRAKLDNLNITEDKQND